MTQAEKDEIIKDLQEKLAEAEKIEVDNKRWKPKEREIYYYVEPNGDIDSCEWMTAIYDGPFDDWHYLTGNCFKTEEEAEEYKKQIEYTAHYKNYIEEHSEPLDWNDERQKKYYAGFGYEENEIGVYCYFTWKTQGTIYATSEQIIWDAIKEIGEDNFKKYVLGVK